MYLKMRWPSSSHWREDKKLYLNLCWPNLFHISVATKCIITCPHMPAKTQNVSQHVLTKPLAFQRGHNRHFNTFWQNPSHDTKDKKCFSTCDDETHHMPASKTKYISTCVEQTYLMPARTKNISQLVLNRHIPCLWGQKYISTCIV